MRTARDFVTIVSGLPRAGTSLAMQILAGGGVPSVSDGRRVPDAANPRGYQEHALVRRLGSDPAAAALVRGACGRALKVVHALVASLPPGPAYRVIWMERPLAEVVASQGALLARSGEPDVALAPERVAAVLAAQADAALAALAARTDVSLLRVRADALVAEPARECARIDAFLGGGLDVSGMIRAISPALYGRTRGYTGAMLPHAREALGPVALEVEHRAPGPAGGPTLRVKRAGDGRELLRFDCFAQGAHWHCDPEGRDEITGLGPEVESLDWTLAELGRDLAGYLSRAGCSDPLPGPDAIAAALERVEVALRNPPPAFDALTLPVLRARTGEKWHLYGPDVQALWVADMDFMPAEPIRRRLQRALDVGDFGYPLHPRPTGLPELYAARALRRYGWRVDPTRVELISEVVQGMFVAIEQLTAPGDGVVVQTPIYPPFLGAVREMKRTLRENRLVQTPGGYRIDFDDLRAQARGARMLLLCNPHNPTGRVFTREELAGIAAVAEEHDLAIVADEIHADLTLPGARFTPIASLSPAVEARTLTLTAASKAFNIAGLRLALAIFGSRELKQRFKAFPRHLRGGLGGQGFLATEAAWLHGDEWLAQVVAYLDANRAFVADFVERELPGVVHVPPEATYLAWLDCRALDLQPTPHRFFLERAKVGLSDGATFGAPGEGFVRLNFATSRALLEEALAKLAKALR
jgi:cystathionine beta-lyase